MNEKQFKFYVLKGIYLIMRHLVFTTMTQEEMLDYRKEIKHSTGIDIYGNYSNDLG